MILGVDTDVLVQWTLREANAHLRVRRWLSALLSAGDLTLGIAPQVWHEWLHVVTDPRRFESPLAMARALAVAAEMRASPEVVDLVASPDVLPRTLQLLERHGLGRKRILDTALAATLEQAGVRRLATLNGRDYRAFSFLEVVAPD